jgi:hypothetical protein
MPRQDPGENRESLILSRQLKYLPAEKTVPALRIPERAEGAGQKTLDNLSADPDFKFASGSDLSASGCKKSGFGAQYKNQSVFSQFLQHKFMSTGTS